MKKRASGFTLLDLVVTAVLVGIIMVAGINFLSFARTMHQEQEDAIRAAYFAASQIEDLKYLTMRFNNIFDDTTTKAPLKEETGKDSTPRIAGILPAGFTLTYNVDDMKWESTNTRTEYKEIQVTCVYPTHGRSVKLTGYVYK